MKITQLALLPRSCLSTIMTILADVVVSEKNAGTLPMGTPQNGSSTPNWGRPIPLNPSMILDSISFFMFVSI